MKKLPKNCGKKLWIKIPKKMSKNSGKFLQFFNNFFKKKKFAHFFHIFGKHIKISRGVQVCFWPPSTLTEDFFEKSRPQRRRKIFGVPFFKNLTVFGKNFKKLTVFSASTMKKSPLQAKTLETPFLRTGGARQKFSEDPPKKFGDGRRMHLSLHFLKMGGYVI